MANETIATATEIPADLLDRALALGPEARTELARRLFLSVGEIDAALRDPDYDEAWAAELEGRLAAVDRGEAVPFDWRADLDRLRRVTPREPSP